MGRKKGKSFITKSNNQGGTSIKFELFSEKKVVEILVLDKNSLELYSENIEISKEVVLNEEEKSINLENSNLNTDILEINKDKPESQLLNSNNPIKSEETGKIIKNLFKFFILILKTKDNLTNPNLIKKNQIGTNIEIKIEEEKTNNIEEIKNDIQINYLNEEDGIYEGVEKINIDENNKNIIEGEIFSDNISEKKILEESKNEDEKINIEDLPIRKKIKEELIKTYTLAYYYNEKNENNLNEDKNEEIKNAELLINMKRKIKFNFLQIEYEYPVEENPPKVDPQQIIIVDKIKKEKNSKKKKNKIQEDNEDLSDELIRLQEVRNRREEHELLEKMRKEEEDARKKVKRENEEANKEILKGNSFIKMKSKKKKHKK